MKGKTFLIISLVLALMLLASFTACKEATPPTPAPAPTLTPVPTQAPSPKPHVSAQGRLSYVDHASLIFGTSGKVSQVNVLNGDKVTNGQLLAKLDTSTPLELAMRTAKIDLEIATDKYRKITYPYDYRTFAFDVPAAVALTGDVQRELNEAVEAMQKSGKNPEQFSGEQYWDVFNCLKRAQEASLKARENLIRGYGADVFQSGVLRMTDFWTLRAAQLEMEKAQLALDKANDDLKKAVIIAPFDGVIAKVNVKVGDFLSPGNYATTIAIEIIDPSPWNLILWSMS